MLCPQRHKFLRVCKWAWRWVREETQCNTTGHPSHQPSLSLQPRRPLAKTVVWVCVYLELGQGLGAQLVHRPYHGRLLQRKLREELTIDGLQPSNS